MSAFTPPTPLLCVLVCMAACAPAVPRSDLRLAYVSDRSLYYCSCIRDLRPCPVPSPTDCSCKDLPLSVLQRPPQQPSSPGHMSPHGSSAQIVRTRRLTVWYTAPQLVARLLNDSEVRHLTLLRCGPLGSGAEGPSSPPGSPEGYFAVQHLEQLTVLRLQRRADKDRNDNPDPISDPETERNVHRNTNKYTDKGRGDRDTNVDVRLDTDKNPSAPAWVLSLSQTQDLLLGRELGAAYHEQARLGLIHTSVLEGRTAVKAYTVQTHIDSNGDLPFPNLHLSKLPETSSIYVSFIY